MKSAHEEEIPPQKLLEAVAELYNREIPALSEERFSGGQYHVYKVEFPDGTTWAVRVPTSAFHVPGALISAMKEEIDMIRELNRNGFRWAPSYCGASLTFGNLINRPFLALSWIRGTTLEWSDKVPTLPLRNEILKQIALIQVERIERTLKEDEAGCENAEDFFKRILRNRRARVSDGTILELTQDDCESQQTRLFNVLYADMNLLSAIDHGDESPRNILCDPGHTIVGLLDYGFAQRVPLQVAAGFPLLLKTRSPNYPVTLSLQEDRQAYAEALKSLESYHPRAVPHILRVQAARDVDYRIWVLESARSKSIHIDMVGLGWKLP